MPGTTSHKARASEVSAVVVPSAEAELASIAKTKLPSICTLPEVRSDLKPKGKDEEKTGQGPDLRAFERRLAANGNVFDDLAEDYFIVVGSSDESEPEHGLTDDSDTDDGEGKRNEGGSFNFDDLDDAEFMDDESGDSQPRVWRNVRMR